jgi:hypothetical protein
VRQPAIHNTSNRTSPQLLLGVAAAVLTPPVDVDARRGSSGLWLMAAWGSVAADCQGGGKAYCASAVAAWAFGYLWWCGPVDARRRVTRDSLDVHGCAEIAVRSPSPLYQHLSRMLHVSCALPSPPPPFPNPAPLSRLLPSAAHSTSTPSAPIESNGEHLIRRPSERRP